jgi:hypothetical protein
MMMKVAQKMVSSFKMVSNVMIFLAIFLLAVLYPAAQGGMAKDLTITIVHANNTAGHLFACPT